MSFYPRLLSYTWIAYSMLRLERIKILNHLYSLQKFILYYLALLKTQNKNVHIPYSFFCYLYFWRPLGDGSFSPPRFYNITQSPLRFEHGTADLPMDLWMILLRFNISDLGSCQCWHGSWWSRLGGRSAWTRGIRWRRGAGTGGTWGQSSPGQSSPSPP